MNLAAKIEILKAFALANYSNGMDTFVECYDTAEWEEMLGECGGSVEEAKKLMGQLAEVFSERQADAAYYANDAKEPAVEVTETAVDFDEEQESANAEAAFEWSCEMAQMRAMEYNPGY